MTKETEVQPAPELPKVSREREEDLEVVETVELEQPEPEPPKPGMEDPRSEIYKRHAEKREQEVVLERDGFAVENFENDDESDEISVESQDSADIIDDASGQSDTRQDSDDLVTVKILGDFRQVPRKKVEAAGGIENYQIRIAAQEQMERNAHEAKALAARQAAIDERERRIAEKEAAIPAMDSQKGRTPDRSTRQDGQNLEELARQALEAVYDDADEAPARLVQTVKAAVDEAVAQAGRQGEAVDVNALRKQIRDDILHEQRQAKVVKATHALIEAHPELNQRDPKFDPRMFQAIDTETTVVEREHPDWEPDQVVQEAYDRIARWRGTTRQQTQTMSDKQAQKRAMNRPRVGTARYQPPAEPPRQTNSDYVAAERRRRGLE